MERQLTFSSEVVKTSGALLSILDVEPEQSGDDVFVLEARLMACVVSFPNESRRRKTFWFDGEIVEASESLDCAGVVIRWTRSAVKRTQ